MTMMMAAAQEVPAMEETKQQEHTDGDQLANELWDMILNGADRHGRGFLDPAERVLPRVVCARWKSIIENPSARSTRSGGHLHRAWCSMAHRFTKIGAQKRRSAFESGRMATLTGAVLFACAGQVGPLDKRDPVSDSPVLEHDGDDAMSVRVQLYCDTVGTLRMGTLHECIKRAHLVSRIIRGDLYYHDPIADGAKRIIDVPLLDKLPLLLVRLGFGRMALRVYASPEFIALYRTASFKSAMTMHHFVCAVARSPYEPDDMPLFLAALNLLVHHRDSFAGRGVDDACVGRRIWRALAVAGAVRCIAALVALVDTERDDGTTAAIDRDEQGKHAHIDEDENDNRSKLVRLVVDEAHAMGMNRSFLHYENLIESLRTARMIHRGATAYLDTCKHWARHAVCGIDPVGVLRAHGTGYCDAALMYCRAAVAGLYDVALAVASAVRQEHGIALSDEPTIVDHLVGHVPRVGPKHIEMVARLGMAVTHERVSGFVTGAAWSYRRYHMHPTDVDVVEAIANRWPLFLIEQPSIVVDAFARMIQDGRFHHVERLIIHLSPLFDERIALFHRVDHAGKGAHEPTLWDSVASGVLRVDHIQYHEDAINYSQERPQRVLVLAKLAHYCGTDTNPTTFAAWRFWCGTPRPLVASPIESATMVLARQGLLI